MADLRLQSPEDRYRGGRERHVRAIGLYVKKENVFGICRRPRSASASAGEHTMDMGHERRSLVPTLQICGAADVIENGYTTISLTTGGLGCKQSLIGMWACGTLLERQRQMRLRSKF